MFLSTCEIMSTIIGALAGSIASSRVKMDLFGVIVCGTLAALVLGEPVGPLQVLGGGIVLAAVAALMYCISYPQVSPMMGAMLGLKAFVAAVLGGIGSIPGAMVGGLLIGVAESLTKAYIGTITAGVITSAFSDAIVFGILIIVLLVKPSGLMGEPESEKV